MGFNEAMLLVIICSAGAISGVLYYCTRDSDFRTMGLLWSVLIFAITLTFAVMGYGRAMGWA